MPSNDDDDDDIGADGYNHFLLFATLRDELQRVTFFLRFATQCSKKIASVL